MIRTIFAIVSASLGTALAVVVHALSCFDLSGVESSCEPSLGPLVFVFVMTGLFVWFLLATDPRRRSESERDENE